MTDGTRWLPGLPLRLSRRARRRALLIALGLFAMAVIGLRQVGGNPTPNRHVLAALSPGIRLVAWIDGLVIGSFTWTLDLLRARGEVERLREENELLRLQTHQMATAMRRVGEWPALVAMAEELSLPTVSARVISTYPHAREPDLLVDVGEAEGVDRGSPVLTAEGLLGRIVTLTGSLSVVRPLTSTSFNVLAFHPSTEIVGLVTGQGQGQPLRFVPEDQGRMVSPGDVLVTAGVESSLYPEGIPIGRVTEIRTSEWAIREALVEPFSDPIGQADVIVVTGSLARHRLAGGDMLLGERPEPVSPEVTADSATGEITAEGPTPEVTAGAATAEAAP